MISPSGRAERVLARVKECVVIERLRPGAHAMHARVALFDFDGTISTIRSGWMDVMVPMMVEILSSLRTGESEQKLTELVVEFVTRLTGKQTIYQMIELAEQVARRGGAPDDPLAYKKLYLDRLHDKIGDRLTELRGGHVPFEKFMVPGSIALLDALRDRGLKLILASGTDQPLVQEEARLLDVTRYFDGGVFGALEDYQSFSKRILIQDLIASAGYRGEELLGFGDGYVEIENIKEANGTAVGVASDEPECLRVEPWKRARLAAVGADFIVPNYLDLDELLETLFSDEHALSHV